MKRFALLAVSAGVLALFASVGLGMDTRSEAAVSVVQLALTGASETPPVANGGSGTARIQFDDVSRILKYDLATSGIDASQVTAAHIHRGAAGIAGPVAYPLTLVAPGVFSGQATIADADLADLKAGNLYLNVHSVANPGGFARVQLILDPMPAIRSSIDQIIAAWNARDVPGFLGGFTDKGVLSSFEAPRAAAFQFVGEFIGSPALKLVSAKLVSFDGKTALVQNQLAFGIAISTVNDTFVLEGGRWKIDNEEDLTTPVPAGTATINLELKDFSFVYDKAAVASGNVAFIVKNTGKQDHEVILVKLDPSVNLQQALASESDGPPPGVQDIAQAGPFDPGQGDNMVFTQALAPGRYAMVCFIPDEATGIPHALLGMSSEFTVGSGAPSGTVRPPNTGDAGLVASQSGTARLYLMVAGIALLTIGAGTLAASRIRR